MSAPLELLAEVIRREIGISTRGSQLKWLEAALSRLEPPMDAAAFLQAQGSAGGPGELLDRLIDEVTVRETFFFRQRDELDAIDWPRLLDAAHAAGSSTVRVWVAACASGEEAYTLAMLASRGFGTTGPPVSIIATDISRAALERARRGRYRGRTLHALEDEMRGHFVPSGDGLAVGEGLRRLVEFRRHNLVRDPVPPHGTREFELIACRNVLIYFDGETVERVIGSLEGALAPGGMLVLGAADRLCGSTRRLARLDGSRTPRERGLRVLPEQTLRRPLRRDHGAVIPAAPREREAAPAPHDLTAALQAANEGGLHAAIEITGSMLRADALDADAYFVRGLAELGLGDTNAAVSSLRRALYVDPSFGLAAFQLARAHEQRGDGAAAARVYEQALRTLAPGDTRHDAILDQVDLGDVAAACAMRLKALRGGAAA